MLRFLFLLLLFTLSASAELAPCDVNLTLPESPTINIFFYGDDIDAHKVVNNDLSFWFDSGLGYIAGVLGIVFFMLPFVIAMYQKKALSYISGLFWVLWIAVLLVSGYSVYMSTPTAHKELLTYSKKVQESKKEYKQRLLTSKKPSCALKAFEQNLTEVTHLERFADTPEIANRLGSIYYNGTRVTKDYIIAQEYFKYAQEHNVKYACLNYELASKLTGIKLGMPPCEYINLFYMYDYYTIGDKVAREHNCTNSHFYKTLIDLYKKEFMFSLLNGTDDKSSSDVPKECFYTAIFFENHNYRFGVKFAKEFKCDTLLKRYSAHLKEEKKEDENNRSAKAK